MVLRLNAASFRSVERQIKQESDEVSGGLKQIEYNLRQM